MDSIHLLSCIVVFSPESSQKQQKSRFNLRDGIITRLCWSLALWYSSYFRVTAIYNFHSVRSSQFYEDPGNLFHIWNKHNIVHYMCKSLAVQYYVQTGFRTVCSLRTLFIIQQAFDTFRLRWEVLFEVIFIVVLGHSSILLDVLVCEMSIPMLPIWTLT